jgi:hypothetical protein
MRGVASLPRVSSSELNTCPSSQNETSFSSNHVQSTATAILSSPPPEMPRLENVKEDDNFTEEDKAILLSSGIDLAELENLAKVFPNEEFLPIGSFSTEFDILLELPIETICSTFNVLNELQKNPESETIDIKELAKNLRKINIFFLAQCMYEDADTKTHNKLSLIIMNMAKFNNELIKDFFLQPKLSKILKEINGLRMACRMKKESFEVNSAYQLLQSFKNGADTFMQIPNQLSIKQKYQCKDEKGVSNFLKVLGEDRQGFKISKKDPLVIKRTLTKASPTTASVGRNSNTLRNIVAVAVVILSLLATQYLKV